jgi:hypothetical protein
MICSCGREELQFNSLVRVRGRVIAKLTKNTGSIICSRCIQRMLNKEDGQKDIKPANT